MKMRNRLFAVLLAVTMVITYMPSVAFAVEPANNDSPTEAEDQLNADKAGAPEDGNDAGKGQDDEDVDTDKGQGISGDDSGDISGEMRGAGDSGEEGDEDPSETSSIPYVSYVSGNTSNTVSTENTASSYELSFMFECSENEASNLSGYFGIEKRYDHSHAFTIVEEDTGMTYNPESGYATLRVKVVSKKGLEEGGYSCDLFFTYDKNGQGDYSERTSIMNLSLDVLNYDSQAYKIYVDAPYFGTIDPELTQSEINEEYGDDKGVTITNYGTGPVNVSKDSYVIDTETSDVDAFVIEYADEDVTIDSDETWTGMTVLPKAGMEEGRYRLYINVYDETGYATASECIEYRVGDPLFIETDQEEIYFNYSPYNGQPVSGPWGVSLQNDSDSTFINVKVESSDPAFKAEIDNAEEDGSIDWQGGGWVQMTVDVTDEYPAKSAEGVITVTATAANGKSAECKINVYLRVDGSADPSFNDTETALEFSIEEMLKASNPAYDEDEDEGGGQLFYVSFNPARNNTYNADLSGLIRFTLSGEDAELFNTRDFLSVGSPYVGIVPDPDYDWAAGTYEFALNMYYDPDGNVSTDGEQVDSLDFKLEVYDQDDYKITICHEDGTPVDKDEDVSLGTFIPGYDPADGEAAFVLKYDGKDPIEITPECFRSRGGYDEDYSSDITSISFIDGVNGVKTLNKGDTYRFKVAPTAGNDIDSYYDEYEITAADGRAKVRLCLEYSVVHDGLYLEFFDDDEEVVLEPDESGNITADLGINTTDDDEAEPDKQLYLCNEGSVPLAISIEKKSGGNKNISCKMGFSENDYEDYEEDTEWILDPGQNIDALVAADYEALCENEGVYRASFVVTATAVDEDNQTDTSYAPLVYTLNAVYEISDEMCEVSFNFRGKGDYVNQTVEVLKGSYIDSALSELYEELGDNIYYYENLKADGYKCIGYSYTENNSCSTWDEYYDMFNGRDRTVRGDMTVYFDWAKTVDPIKLEMAVPKCGDTVSDVNKTLSISGGGDHISLNSVKWRKIEYNSGYATQYLQDDSVFDGNSDNSSHSFEIKVTPDFGWTVGDVSLNEGDVYVYVYGRGNENTISGNVNVKHRITQIAGTGSTCDKTGLRNHYKCVGCENLFKDRNGYEPAMLDELTIPAKGHKWEKSYEWSADNSSVTATAVCSRDSGHKIQETAVAEPSTDATSCEVERHVTYTATFENPEFVTQTKEDTLPAGEHSWNSGTVTKPATCTEPGKKTVTCTVCGETEERTIPALNHDYQYSRMQWTKTAEGYTAKALYVCANDSTHTETFDAEVTSKTTDATCEAAGQTVYTAAYDGHTEKKTDVIPALGHDYQYSTMEWIKTANGYTAKAVYVCANDSTHTEKHKAEVTSKTTAATCEAAGQTVYTAAYDGQTDTKTEVIPALGHNYQYSRMEWTKTESGYTAKALYVCANDSTHTEQHNAEVTSETTGATCEAAGQTVYTAAYDGNTDTKTEVIPALNHDWDDPTYVWAADNSSVTATRVCKRDGTHKETKTVSTEAESDATSCDVEKHVKYTATFEAPFTPQEKTVTVAAGEHAWNSGTVTKPATCTEAGVKTLTCNVCGETKEEPIPALNHNYQYSKMEWTKTESGYTAKALYVCANDSKHTEQHDAEVTFETTAATCETDGQTVYTARYDGNTDTKTDVIPALDHDWDEWAKISDEQHKRFCKRNNEHFETGNHVWDEGTIADPANETDKRIKTYTCSVCGGTKEEELPSLLEEAQEKARTELSKYNLNDYSGAEKTNVEKALSTAETAIARATTVETVTNALNEAKTTIAAQKTDAQKNAEASAYTPPAAPAEILDLPAVKITKPASAKKKLTVKWKKVSKKNLKKISGIQIQVATDPGFTNIVKTATAGKKKTSKKIGGLQPKTKYYVRIRAYGAANHYSVWKSKSGKTK